MQSKNMLSILENMVELKEEKAWTELLAKEFDYEYKFQ